MAKKTYWAVQIKTVRSSYIEHAFIRPLRREAFNEWWADNVKTAEDWEYWSRRVQAGEVKAVKVNVEVCDDQ